MDAFELGLTAVPLCSASMGVVLAFTWRGNRGVLRERDGFTEFDG